MKRTGHLWPNIVERANLQDAFHKAAKGKRDRTEVMDFARHLEVRLSGLRQQMLDGSYELGGYRHFLIHDPKEREIHAAPFAQRVMHHAVINVCEPLFERRLIHHSYACRRGKGQYAALAQALSNARRYPFHLKLDIRKYFDSIPHAALYGQLDRIFKCRELMEFWRRFLASYQTKPGRGLPIGSLSSQHLANLFLSPIDRWLQEQSACSAYVRYMDDFVIWGEDSANLRLLRDAVAERLASECGLALKHPGCAQKSSCGMSFLGYRVTLGGLRLSRRSWARFKGKCRRFRSRYESGEWSEATLAAHVVPLAAFVVKAVGAASRTRFLASFGEAAIGLEPR